MSEVQDRLSKAAKPSEDAMRLHPFYRGKTQTAPKCAVRDLDDFSIWYTPGVAAPCRAINQDPELAYEYTNKGNRIAVVTDGTRVLGLGDIGPEAGLPVMEGKCLLFKYLGGVDAVPVCLQTKDPDEIIRTVKLLQPAFGGINLEDFAQPKCFHILDELRADPEVTIPVWHDDQQGTATAVLLAGLINALRLVGKEMSRVRVAMVGLGAANVATLRLMEASGFDLGNLTAVDSRGVIHSGRADLEAQKHQYRDKWRVALESNRAGIRGNAQDALRGADVCIGFSRPGPGTIKPEWVAGMAADAIVFPCANPVPEIWPWEAKAAGARVVGTGRSDFPNQLNNSLGFPAIFRGALDVRARTITDGMCLAAANAIADYALEQGLSDDHIVPSMADREVFLREAVAVGVKAQEEGVARLSVSRGDLYASADRAIGEAQRMTNVLMESGIIPPPSA